MGILGSEISGIWVDECGWSNSPAQYKSRDHNRIMVVILTEIERKGFRYMSFDINFEGAIKDMIERKFITCCNLHTKVGRLHGSFGVLSDGRDFMNVWRNFNAL